MGSPDRDETVTMREDAYMGGIQGESGQGMTSNQVIAGLQSTRTFCLNAITGDPLARLIRGPVVWDDITTRGTTTPVEFTAETMAAFMTEVIALVERLDSNADGAGELCRVESQTAESLEARNAVLEREANTLRRVAGIPLEGPLPTWAQRYAETVAESVPESAPQTTTATRLHHAGDVCRDRYGSTWTVDGWSTNGRPIMLRGDGSGLVRLLHVLESDYGPLVWGEPEAVSARESDGETSAGTETPGDGTGALVARVPLPMGSLVGDVCTDSEGTQWVVRKFEGDSVMCRIREERGIATLPLPHVEGRWGPLTWQPRDEQGASGTPTPDDAGEAAYGASTDAEDDAVGDALRARRRVETDAEESWVPAVGDRCTDRDGDVWTVSRLSNVHGPILLSDSGYLNETMTDVAKKWGTLRWDNGRTTHGS